MSARPRPAFGAIALGLFAASSSTSILPVPLSGLAAYIALGFLPGFAVAALFGPSWSLGARITLGLALSPLVTTAAAVLLLRAGVEMGVAATIVVFFGVVGSLNAWGSTPPTGKDPDFRSTPDGRFVLLWSLGLAAAVAFPALVNRYVPIRSDGWIHAGLIWEIVHHGIPPEDPRFAGLPLNYVWFFNAFIALLVRLSGDGPFFFMPLFNVVQAGLTASLAYRIGLAVWRDRAAARGTLLMVVLGFNAAAYLLWPLGFIPQLAGDVRGSDMVMKYLQGVKFPHGEIIFSLNAPFSLMVNFFDKLLTGTAVHHAYVLMMVHLWALFLWLEDRRTDSLVLAIAAAAGMLFFHGVVGLSVVPVSVAVVAVLCLLRTRWHWLPGAGTWTPFGVATAVGGLLAMPYTRSIWSGWAEERSGLSHSYFRFDAIAPWTLLTATAVAWWFAREPIRRLFRERLPGPAAALALAVGMSVFACVVRLPGGNETKFAFEAFVPLAAVAGAALPAIFSRWTERWGHTRAALLFTIVFLVNPVLSVTGFAFDPGPRIRPELNPRPGEEALERWIRDETPKDAVIVDAWFRDFLMVKGQRRLYLGTSSGPEKAAFPARELERRRALVSDLYGAGRHWPQHRDALLALRRPIYILFRPEDSGAAEPWRPLERFAGDVHRVYEHDGYRVYRLRFPTESAGGPP
ncbi:MAG TPA: hypothetical protein VEY91_01450 [Candidatus Limnocylindria bacterium]|nr:hypothetical protein [Candidatus Limnocylindria bacterium]